MLLKTWFLMSGYLLITCLVSTPLPLPVVLLYCSSLALGVVSFSFHPQPPWFPPVLCFQAPAYEVTWSACWPVLSTGAFLLQETALNLLRFAPSLLQQLFPHLIGTFCQLLSNSPGTYCWTDIWGTMAMYFFYLFLGKNVNQQSESIGYLLLRWSCSEKQAFLLCSSGEISLTQSRMLNRNLMQMKEQ